MRRRWAGPWRLDRLQHRWYRRYTDPYPGIVMAAGWQTTAIIKAIEWGPLVPAYTDHPGRTPGGAE